MFKEESETEFEKDRQQKIRNAKYELERLKNLR